MEFGQILKIVESHRTNKHEGYHGSYYLYEFCIKDGTYFDFDERRIGYSAKKEEYTKLGDIDV